MAAEPVRVEVGDQRTQVLRMRKREPLDTIAFAIGVVPDLVIERGFESPLRLRPLGIGRRRGPALYRSMRLRKESGHPRPAVEVFVRGKSPERAHLKDIAIGEPRGRPSQAAIDDADRGSRLEAALHETLVGLRQMQILQAK